LTAADYTVEFEISEKFFAKFKQFYELEKAKQTTEQTQQEVESIVIQFRRWLTV